MWHHIDFTIDIVIQGNEFIYGRRGEIHGRLEPYDDIAVSCILIIDSPRRGSKAGKIEGTLGGNVMQGDLGDHEAEVILSAAGIFVVADLELDRRECVLEKQRHRRAGFIAFAHRDQQVFLLTDLGRDGIDELPVGNDRGGAGVVAGRIELVRVSALGPIQVFVPCGHPAVAGIREQVVVHPFVGSTLDAYHVEGTDGGDFCTAAIAIVDYLDDKGFPSIRGRRRNTFLGTARKGGCKHQCTGCS